MATGLVLLLLPLLPCANVDARWIPVVWIAAGLGDPAALLPQPAVLVVVVRDRLGPVGGVGLSA